MDTSSFGGSADRRKLGPSAGVSFGESRGTFLRYVTLELSGTSDSVDFHGRVRRAFGLTLDG
ncbi:MAG: hypothetical protein KDC38_11435, partial [Planctomycetes bacterium]|nr:hypothetical protein [Planctomycetota bacterium]